MIRRLLRASVALAVYLAVLGRVEPWDVASGAILAAALLVAFRRLLAVPRRRVPTGRRLGAVPPLCGRIAADVVRGTWSVFLRALGVRQVGPSGFVEVPILDRTEAGVAATALAETLSPGSVLVEVDWERKVMIFHVMELDDPEAVRERIQRFYRRHQRRVVP